MDENGKINDFDFNRIVDEATQNLKVCIQLVKERQQAFDSIYSKSKLDIVQIGLVTLIAMITNLITGRGLLSSFFMIIRYPIGIFIGGGILALLVVIGKGNVDYIKLVNITAYTGIFTAVAAIFGLVPIVGGLVMLAASVYTIILNILAIIEKAGADQKRVLIAVAIFIGVIFIIGIIFIALVSLAVFSSGILDWIS